MCAQDGGEELGPNPSNGSSCDRFKRNSKMSADASTTTSLPVPIKVAIIEDQRTIREGLAALIGGTDGFRCTGSYRVHGRGA